MRWEVVDSLIVDELPPELVELLTASALSGDLGDPLDLLLAEEALDFDIDIAA